LVDDAFWRVGRGVADDICGVGEATSAGGVTGPAVLLRRINSVSIDEILVDFDVAVIVFEVADVLGGLRCGTLPTSRSVAGAFAPTGSIIVGSRAWLRNGYTVFDEGFVHKTIAVVVEAIAGFGRCSWSVTQRPAFRGVTSLIAKACSEFIRGFARTLFSRIERAAVTGSVIR